MFQSLKIVHNWFKEASHPLLNIQNWVKETVFLIYYLLIPTFGKTEPILEK
jgi:hypothetical protein